jgi:hypothetical protein
MIFLCWCILFVMLANKNINMFFFIYQLHVSAHKGHHQAILEEMHKWRLTTYCDMTPESSNNEVRVDVHCQATC